MWREGGWEPTGKFQRFLRPRERDRHLDPLKVCLCLAIRMLAVTVTGVNWGCLRGCQHDLHVSLKRQAARMYEDIPKGGGK